MERKNHLLKSLRKGLRYDGRSHLDIRDIEIEYNISKSAEGSARVRVGDTIVFAGVKMMVGTPYSDTPDKGALMVGAELLPMSSPDFELGPPGIQSIELARVVDRGIRESGMIDMEDLCIKAGEKVWMVSIDIITVNNAGGLLDASAIAATAALKNTRFPKLEGDKVNYKELTDRKLKLNHLPVAVTVYNIAGELIVDPVLEEENVYDSRLTVTTLDDETVCALQKGGESPLTIEEIDKMVEIGAKKGVEIRAIINKKN